MNSLKVELPLDEETSKKVVSAVSIELEGQANNRSKAKLSWTGTLDLEITADDLSALRAAMNTNLRLVDTSLKLIK